MVLIKNVATTSKGDWFFWAQQYTIFSKVVDEGVQTHLLQLHNTLSNTQPTFREVNFFFFAYIIYFLDWVNFNGSLINYYGNSIEWPPILLETGWPPNWDSLGSC
jgi:hypothetical protein